MSDMGIPDLGALGRGDVKPPPVLLNPPDDVFVANSLGVSIDTDGTVILSCRYVVDHAVGIRGQGPDATLVTRRVAAKHLHVRLPVDVLVGKLLGPAPEIVQAALAAVQNYVAGLTSEPDEDPSAPGDAPPSPEELADARRRAAGDDGGG